jgi:hypothetical protein
MIHVASTRDMLILSMIMTTTMHTTTLTISTPSPLDHRVLTLLSSSSKCLWVVQVLEEVEHPGEIPFALIDELMLMCRIPRADSVWEEVRRPEAVVLALSSPWVAVWVATLL